MEALQCKNKQSYVVSEFENYCLIYILLSSLLYEEYKLKWSHLKVFVHHMIIRKKRKDINFFVRIGCEKLKIYIQIYKQIIVIPMIRNWIFGNQFNKIT